MPDRPRVSRVRFTPAPDSAVVTGLIGWVSCVIDDSIRLDGLRVRRTREGDPTISWPYRRDRAGREHAVVAPVDDATRRRLEAQVMAALDLGDGDAL